MRDEVDQARRQWRQFKIVEAARMLAKNDQVRAALGEAERNMYDAIDGGYTRGRLEWSENRGVTVSRNSDPLAIAGCADAMLASIGVES